MSFPSCMWYICRFIVHGVYDSMELLQHMRQMVNRLFYPLPIKTYFKDLAYTSCWNGILPSFESNFCREMIWLSMPSKLDIGSRMMGLEIWNLRWKLWAPQDHIHGWKIATNNAFVKSQVSKSF